MNSVFKTFSILFLFLFNFIFCTQIKNIKESHLSNAWYPSEKTKLKNEIKFYIDKAKKEFKIKNKPTDVKVIIAPHAGFYYSGLCAASTYQTLLNRNEKNKKIKNVIILAPSHTKYFEGIATPSFDIYKTALGNIKVNKNKIKKLELNKNISFVENAFNTEHAIEIQLPFLQETIENFEIIPLIVGAVKDNDYANVANSLKGIIDDNSLIVISSDFIHYGKDYNYTPFNNFILDSIRYVDSEALYAIGKKSFINFNNVVRKTGATICGQNAIKVILKMLENKDFVELEPRLTCYYTSAQMNKARNENNINIRKLLSDLPDNEVKNSVSYAGLIFTKEHTQSSPKATSDKVSVEKLKTLNEEEQLTGYEKKSLLNLAHISISNEFKKEKKPEHLLFPIKSLGLEQKRGIFVTLHKNGNLRGCIGRITSNQELFKTVSEMAKFASFNDTRFQPLTEDELNDIDIEISILTEPKKINHYQDIQLGKDGIILKKITKSGINISSVFLPEVAPGQKWTLEQTLEQLSLKAGFGKDEWKNNACFEIFQSFKIKSE